MIFGQLLCSCVLLTTQLGSKPPPHTRSFGPVAVDVRKQLAEQARGETLQYAKAVKAHAESLTPSELGPHVVELADSGDPQARDIAFSILWEDGRDGQLAGALAYAINRELCASHIIWLTKQVRPTHIYGALILKKLHTHDEPRVRVAALTVMARIAKEEPSTVHDLINSFRVDDDIDVRTAAVRILGRLGPSANQAVPTLLSALNRDEDLRLCLEAARSLQRIEPAHSILQRTLRDLEKSIRNQLGDAKLDTLISNLEFLVAEQKRVRKRTRKVYEFRVLEYLLD